MFLRNDSYPSDNNEGINDLIPSTKCLFPANNVFISVVNLRLHFLHLHNYFTINAKYHDVYLLFVPKYTPRLNLAETPMKEIKRYLSPLFLENAEKIKEKVIEGFEEFKKNN